MVSPMTTVPLVNAVVFSAYEHAKAFLLTRRLNDTSGVLTNHEAMMAGAWAGFVNSIVVTPRVFSAQLDGDNGKVSPATTLLAGGFAGCVCWTVSYPQDVIKSRLQLQPLGQPSSYATSTFCPDGGFIACAKSIVRQEGWRGLWRGYSPCLLRAFPSNAAGFATYEMVKSVFFLDKDGVSMPVQAKAKAGQ
ncbi:hypothetical protein B5M09_011014 [Aphanomyces astaci]|uniref:Uncharacterized protein n=1 Tax=Aphanomyces astaci TaxID=112090 RepID=A0A3R7Z3Z1_APHAT|nr:hypothetical protein B5M09_011014 [Aphanomyces astaci]